MPARGEHTDAIRAMNKTPGVLNLLTTARQTEMTWLDLDNLILDRDSVVFFRRGDFADMVRSPQSFRRWLQVGLQLRSLSSDLAIEAEPFALHRHPLVLLALYPRPIG